MVKADKYILKKWILWSGIVFAVVYSLNCFLISPLTSALINDVVYADTAIPTVLGYLNELFELGAISFLYAVLLLTVYRYGTGKTVSVFVLFALATLFKYTGNTALTWIFDASIPTLWGWDIVNIFYYTLLELVQLLIIFLFVKGVITKYTDKRLVMKRAIEKTGKSESDKTKEAYPFTKLFDMKNCLLKSAFICALVTVVAKLWGAVISDVWLMIVYGAPNESVTWLLMIVNYLTKIIFGAVSYLFITLSMTALSANMTAKTNAIK